MPSSALRRLVVRRLLARRKKLGWSQAELSRRSGLPQSYISNLEGGKHSPTIDALALLAEALGMGVDELVVAN